MTTKITAYADLVGKVMKANKPMSIYGLVKQAICRATPLVEAGADPIAAAHTAADAIIAENKMTDDDYPRTLLDQTVAGLWGARRAELPEHLKARPTDFDEFVGGATGAS